VTILIRDPENNPTPKDPESLEPHPSIAQLAVNMWTTDEIKIPQIDPELLVRSQPVNYLPGSPGEGNTVLKYRRKKMTIRQLIIYLLLCSQVFISRVLI
jgi:hypothetical protein